MVDDKDLVVVDCELIRRLKREGRSYEANQLIKAHHEILKKNWKDVRKQNINLIIKLVNHNLMRQGLCVKCREPKEKSRLKYRLCIQCSWRI